MSDELLEIFLVVKIFGEHGIFETVEGAFASLEGALGYCLYAQKEKYNTQLSKATKEQVIETSLNNHLGKVSYDYDNNTYHVIFSKDETLTVRKMSVRL